MGRHSGEAIVSVGLSEINDSPPKGCDCQNVLAADCSGKRVWPNLFSMAYWCVLLASNPTVRSLQLMICTHYAGNEVVVFVRCA